MSERRSERGGGGGGRSGDRGRDRRDDYEERRGGGGGAGRSSRDDTSYGGSRREDDRSGGGGRSDDRGYDDRSGGVSRRRESERPREDAAPPAPPSRGGAPSSAFHEEDAKLEFEDDGGLEVCATFERMGLQENLLRGVYAYGFEKPSAIQQRAIVPILRGRDMIAQSQSGTGKTAVFSIGILQCLDMGTSETQALVLSPTRELAEQTQKVIASQRSTRSSLGAAPLCCVRTPRRACGRSQQRVRWVCAEVRLLECARSD